MLNQPHISEVRNVIRQQAPPEWYVAYTYPKAEKKVQSKLEKIGIQSYLPLHQIIRDWSDRKKKLIVPLFPSYIFINSTPGKKHEIFAVKEIVRYVSFGGRPATVNDSIINSLQNILKQNAEVDIEKYIKEGSPVKITEGPFAGTEGFLIRRNGKTRLLVQIDALQQGITVNISINDVTPLYIEGRSMDSYSRSVIGK